MDSSKLRVIVVGGGPAGLTAAHMLTKAGVDFVVLEKGSTVHPDLGASIAVWPYNFRILDQLGLLGSLEPAMTELMNQNTLTVQGKRFVRQKWLTKHL